MPSTTERAPKPPANTKKAASTPPTPPPAPKPCLSFTARHAELSKAIDAAAALVSGSTSAFAAMQAILLESDAGKLAVTAMSDDARLVATVPAAITREGRALIPAATLAAALKALPAHDDVTVTLDAVKATVKAGATSFKLLSLDPEQYPLFKEMGPAKARFTIPQHDAHRLLTGAAFALPRKDHRRVLLGIFLEHMGGTTLRATATDGKQLARITKDATEASGIAWTEKETRGIVAPRCLIDHARRVLDLKPPKKDHAPETCVLTLHEDGASLETRDAVFKVLAIGGKYPDCDQVIPRDFNGKAVLSSQALAAAARRAGVTADDKSRSLVVKLDAAELSYQSQSYDTGTCEGSFPVKYEGEPVELAFNCDFLTEVLSSLGDGMITVQMATRARTTPGGEVIPGRHEVKHPTIFTATDKPDALLLLMPIKLADATPAPPPASDEADAEE